MRPESHRKVELEPCWKAVLEAEFSQPYMEQLRAFLQQQKQAGKAVYPAGSEIFNAFNTTPFDRVKVVILGQDPYHGEGQAHGLSFSVRPGVRIPPSLVNIYKELERDLGVSPAPHGYLMHWARQGVLLLNSVLTVEQSQAASHQNQGWETFTDRAIARLNEQRDGLVFMLWGSYAQRKGAFIDAQRHCVLRAPHPSPLSAHRGFIGCGHFSAANRWLMERGEAPIDWQLPLEPQ
ncbi:uracil-DNA glycosylase [Aestuariirhabdus litorea]|uniref:Uracil-DNA glycosylase n=1 Tax=Aestuariirhabdus litorea TaxID=2528527 RepID=A0A3P3VR65_9GAMM|nr:uracil-DNA glycosylase [Aestuariirhabdus litorea]RRJ85215.1 uracil-DNA glycosylase [Aestuariirhabdus litorea]RWW98436.1 uracil-DNA glycosylase [Endozoicomonadaceae bacterium GTF-13]